MAQEVQVGTILISEWPQIFGLENEPFSGQWSVVNGLDGFGLDRKIRDRIRPARADKTRVVTP